MFVVALDLTVSDDKTEYRKWRRIAFEQENDAKQLFERYALGLRDEETFNTKDGRLDFVVEGVYLWETPHQSLKAPREATDAVERQEGTLLAKIESEDDWDKYHGFDIEILLDLDDSDK